MKFAVVTPHLPVANGTAAGRLLHAACEGLVAEGHELSVWSWHHRAPEGPLPAWCDWDPVPETPWWHRRRRSLVRPRHDVLGAGWTPPDDAVVIADETISFPAVRWAERPVLVVHDLRRLDALAIRRLTPADVQQVRAERIILRQVPALLATSSRVARATGHAGARFVAAGYHVPGQPLPPVDRPVAAVLADWWWPPNRWALGPLLRAWAEVRDAVPGARLLLGGRGLDRLGTVAGVEVLGPVTRSVDVLAEACVVPFPYPATSGPKVKILEAFANGRAVVTTPAGVEGLVLPAGVGAAVAPLEAFAQELIAVLRDPERRASLAEGGRACVLVHHTPRHVGRAIVTACEDVFEPGRTPDVRLNAG